MHFILSYLGILCIDKRNPKKNYINFVKYIYDTNLKIQVSQDNI